MPEIRISLQELRQLDDTTPSTKDLPALERHVRAQFAFLPQPLELSVDGETVVIRYPDVPAAKLSEAERIADAWALVVLGKAIFRQTCYSCKRV